MLPADSPASTTRIRRIVAGCRDGYRATLHDIHGDTPGRTARSSSRGFPGMIFRVAAAGSGDCDTRCSARGNPCRTRSSGRPARHEWRTVLYRRRRRPFRLHHLAGHSSCSTVQRPGEDLLLIFGSQFHIGRCPAGRPDQEVPVLLGLGEGRFQVAGVQGRHHQLSISTFTQEVF